MRKEDRRGNSAFHLVSVANMKHPEKKNFEQVMGNI